MTFRLTFAASLAMLFATCDSARADMVFVSGYDSGVHANVQGYYIPTRGQPFQSYSLQYPGGVGPIAVDDVTHTGFAASNSNIMRFDIPGSRLHGSSVNLTGPANVRDIFVEEHRQDSTLWWRTWGNELFSGQLNANGTGFTSGGIQSAGSVGGADFAVGNGKLYSIGVAQGGINFYARDLAAGGPDRLLFVDLATPASPMFTASLAIDTLNGYLYWSDFAHGQLKRWGLTADNAHGIEVFAGGLNHPTSLDVDGRNGRVYFLEDDVTLRRISVDGTGLTTIASGLDAPGGGVAYSTVPAPAGIWLGGAALLTVGLRRWRIARKRVGADAPSSGG